MRPLLLTLLLCLTAPATWAESALRFNLPAELGNLQGATYDKKGVRVGAANLDMSRLENGDLRLEVRTGIENGASTVAQAVLRMGSDQKLRVISQQTESVDPQGRRLGVLRVDHEGRRASCQPADGSKAPTRSIELPKRDRIANVALNLLFLPLATGDVEEVDFQLFMCRGEKGPRLLDFEGFVAKDAAQPADASVVEIQYRPNLGGAINWLSRSFLPTFSFWLDHDGAYVAHRIPLYNDGPEVLVVRNGRSPQNFAPITPVAAR